MCSLVKRRSVIISNAGYNRMYINIEMDFTGTYIVMILMFFYFVIKDCELILGNRIIFLKAVSYAHQGSTYLIKLKKNCNITI